MYKPKIGIVGYGRVGKGAELAVQSFTDMELVGIFTRRDPSTVETLTGVEVYSVDELEDGGWDIDVLLLCGGSRTDLPEQTKKYAQWYNVIDSYDQHDTINEHYHEVDDVACDEGTLAIVSVGWDPGLFSKMRALNCAIFAAEVFLHTSWGDGLSQGHSDAIRQIDGVVDARQYTKPIKEAIARIRSDEKVQLATYKTHTRECFVVAEEGADLARIEQEIKTMKNYFVNYETTVHFVTQEELNEQHNRVDHRGFVHGKAWTGVEHEHKHVLEYNLDTDCNAELTGCIMAAYARAAYRHYDEMGDCGCLTALNIPDADLLPLDMTDDEIRTACL